MQKNYIGCKSEIMTELNVYLIFNGNCREAMEFYNSAIDGDLEIMDFASMPDGDKMPEEERHLVMHAKITKGRFVLMASDITSQHGKVSTGTSISLSLNCASDEEIEKFFAALSAGGQVTMPLENMFWGAKFGMFNDKFDMPWMLNYDKPRQ